MNKIEEKHLEAIEGNTYTSIEGEDVKRNRDIATSCAEITKEYAEKFAEWIEDEGYTIDAYHKHVKTTFDVLWERFLNDLNEKP